MQTIGYNNENFRPFGRLPPSGIDDDYYGEAVFNGREWFMENNKDDILVDAPTASVNDQQSAMIRSFSACMPPFWMPIADRVLLPGKKLTESDLCRQMSCSRNTVRGALSLLAHDHIVDLQPNRGAFVRVPDAKETERCV